MKLSKKKKNELYNAVHEEIMQARIKLAKTPDKFMTVSDADDILSKLCYSAPQKAIDLFNTNIKDK